MRYRRVFSAAALAAAVSAPGQPMQSTVEHVDQFELLDLVRSGRGDSAFRLAEAAGNEFFDQQFLRSDGIGAKVGNVPQGNVFLFSRTPRADLRGPGEWFNHFPPRTDGPNGQSCVACHNQPVEDGGGTIVSNINRDPFREGFLRNFIRRNAPHVMAMAGPQLLAEDITTDLQRIRDEAEEDACDKSPGSSVTLALISKGVNFGKVKAIRLHGSRCKTRFDWSQLDGIDSDLVVKPFQWKGTTRFVREFNRGAAHTEMGMQPVELLESPAQDGDFDGIINEFAVGDMTALAVYSAAQPRPVTRLELDSLGLDEVTKAERTAIGRGESKFKSIGCAECHVPRMTTNTNIFREPSRNPNYRDRLFPAGQNPLAAGLDPAFPVRFDITRDQRENIIRDSTGDVITRLGSFRRDSRGRAVVDLFSDLKRHHLGREVQEAVDETASPVPAVPGAFQGGVGIATFLTRPLWGVGSTAPYMHDGNSTTLTEAIERHGGEAAEARRNFRALSRPSKEEVIAFLNNLVLFKAENEPEEDTDEESQPSDAQLKSMEASSW